MTDLSHIGKEQPFDMQTAFNKAFTGLASQQFVKSLSDAPMSFNGCIYSDRYGHRCAIGWMIPDDMIERTVFELGIAQSDVVQDILNVKGHIDALAFLQRIQQAHDYAESPNEMRRMMCKVAREYNLDIPDVADEMELTDRPFDPEME